LIAFARECVRALRTPRAVRTIVSAASSRAVTIQPGWSPRSRASVVCALQAPDAVPSLFPRWSNTAYRGVLVLIAVIAVAAVAAPMIYMRTPYASGRDVPIVQPVEFDHRHHVRDDGIDCLYCHTSAETSAYAGIPSTELCMGCHGQIWRTSPELAPVRQSWATGVAIGWVRVHDLPDHVYFHHGVHVQAGIDCARCHGDVASMARIQRVASLTMGWCIDCHRDPPGPADHGRAITPLTTCTACHR
jgi:predicted CXXCH cytochrome family protein